ncbi:hypothetical protein [Flavobacterium sp. N1736]|uniref:hypothetical protein n=1 Tax=Flavobacterium sp. N1736 TaxID=2986823 RepID=UPI002224ED04|nr:hypothetical protein [Flavobacterium sp. N1736]
MKKRILLVAVFQLFLVLNGCSSDSGNDATPEENKGEIKADYISDVYFADDFVVDANNNVFVTGQISAEIVSYPFRKIDVDGKVTTLKPLDFVYFNSSKISTSKDGQILLIARNNNVDSDKIFRFGNNFSELNPYYTMKPISSPLANKIRLISICDNNDNTYFVFDYNNRQMKRFLPELNTDVFVAGSEKNEIKDGTGLNAGFGSVTKIISQNNVLYLIDNLNTGAASTFVSSNIRKLEYVNNEWKVSTLISTTNENGYYSDIAFDSNNGLYVIVKGKGIYKLNLQDNTLSLFKDGEIKLAAGNKDLSVDLRYAESLKIKNNDLYLLASYNLIKISDFQSKFNSASK